MKNKYGFGKLCVLYLMANTEFFMSFVSVRKKSKKNIIHQKSQVEIGAKMLYNIGIVIVQTKQLNYLNL